MKIVTVTRIFNEDDIVEAFVRHHAHFADELIFLDNGSVDRTVEILGNLRHEGFPITCLRQSCCYFMESLQNTMLYNAAARYSGADWVLFLDADEFIDGRNSDVSLRERLCALPENLDCLKLDLVNYQDSDSDDPNQLVVPRRITRRWKAPHNVYKVCLRGGLSDSGITVDAGNHQAFIGGTPVVDAIERDIVLAHFVRRSPWHEITKSVIGRLKVLAAGQEELRKLRSNHYTPLFERLRDDPEQIMRNADFLDSLNGGGAHLVEDPIAYLGGDLRYTTRTDFQMKAIRCMISYAEALARGHGALLDASRAAGSEMSGFPTIERVV